MYIDISLKNVNIHAVKNKILEKCQKTNITGRIIN